ncbi:MAG: hypothetical protein RTU92_06550 [Candidatus Thorarchaeota archaeon]
MMQSQLQECTPTCKKFRCDRNPSALTIRKSGGRKTIWCNWVDDECDGPYCKFGICLDRKMSDNMKCRQTQQAQTERRDERMDDFVDPGYIPEKYSKKLRGKS